MYVPLCQLPKQKSVYFRSLVRRATQNPIFFFLIFLIFAESNRSKIFPGKFSISGFLVQSFFLYLRLCLWSYMIHNSLKEPLEHKGGLISHEIW
ncbi:hypothetical protein CUMW_047520 [Citrus unshiu]|nr:hypothetical protein CUMW_047520 [Citrus unshiu]GAY39845.1 hypothetical protein CUMW_047520 [Citrus unshiu]